MRDFRLESGSVEFKLNSRATNGASSQEVRSLAGLANGGSSSMVELQFVVLAVAGSSPVGRPPPSPLKRVSVAGCGARLVPVAKAFRAFLRVSLISLTRDWHILFCSTVDTGKIVLRFKD
jgi:hypothetical protein